jgi:hypothetical protein
LEQVRGYKVEKTAEGIYTVVGDIIPIQIINTRELSMEENLWLRDLSNDLKTAAYERVLTAIQRLDKGARIGAYLDVLVRANLAVTEEVTMSEKAMTLEGVLKKAGYIDLWLKQGVEQGISQGISQG